MTKDIFVTFKAGTIFFFIYRKQFKTTYFLLQNIFFLKTNGLVCKIQNIVREITDTCMFT